MENAIPIGLSRQIVLSRALDVTANNLANQNTTGFRSEQTRFAEYLVASAGQSANPNPAQSVSLVQDSDSVTDFSQGALVQTHGALDFAIQGDGFFGVETPDGPQYTRDGHFGISNFGELITRDGLPVLDEGSAPILIDIQLGPVQVSKDGTVQQDGAIIGRIGVFEFDAPQSLQRVGNNRFSSAELPNAAATPAIEQGFVEGSNVNALRGITDLISISRAYTQAAELIETANDLSRDAIRRFTETQV